MSRVYFALLIPLVVGCVHRSPEARVLGAFRNAGYLRGDYKADSAASKCSALAAHVSYMSGDTAIVQSFQDCVRPPGPCRAGWNCPSNAVRFETDYLVLRRDGTWHVEKALGGGTLTAG